MSSLRTISVIGAAAVFLVAVLFAAAGAGITGLSASPGAETQPSPLALDDIPATYLRLYEQAAATCPGLPWSVLAGIGEVETGQGRDNHTSSAGAVGIMQFLPSTFAEYDEPIPPGGANPPSPLDPTDAIYAAARLLCANGGRGGTNISGAIFTYNHSQSYVDKVLSDAKRYSQSETQTVASGTAGATAVDWALAQVGTPYIYGGETVGVGFDCSGLAQAAYGAAGITLPRVAQDQFDAGPQVPPGQPLEPGDLVFFGGSVSDIEHVGLYVGTQGNQAIMVDAPHTGAFVRTEPFPTTIGAPLGGGESFQGATSPGG